jgi:hypothetical protein
MAHYTLHIGADSYNHLRYENVTTFTFRCNPKMILYKPGDMISFLRPKGIGPHSNYKILDYHITNTTLAGQFNDMLKMDIVPHIPTVDIY